ncbi:MAG TPA: MFS transporter [Bacteroidales bacterium]|nr:MFS transporter [Bacteroidales bacterium]
MKSIRKNIISLYLIKFSKWFMLFMPIIVPFYNENGLQLKELFFLQAIYSISIVALEIPSGYLADVLGRRKTLIGGTLLTFTGFLIYTVSYGFWGFLFAEVILGIGTSLISGADSALLYDTLADFRREGEYVKYEGRIIAAGNFAESVAGILGGLLATISLRTPYYFQAGVAFIGIPAAILLTEPSRHSNMIEMSWKGIISIVRFALFEDKMLRRNIFFSSIIGASTLTMAWFVQPYFKLVGIPLGWYGVLWTALNLTVAVTALSAWKFDRRLGEKFIIPGITIFIFIGFMALSIFKSIWALAFLFMFYFVRGVATPVLKDYINRLTTSDIRATVLSVRSFIIRIIFSIVGPFIGWYSDKFSLQSAIRLSGIIFFLLASVTAVLYLLVISRQGDKVTK